MKRYIEGKGIKFGVSALVLSMLLGIVLIPALASPSPVVSVSPASQEVGAGATFSINITVNPDGEGISSGQLFFAFNASVMQVNTVTKGNLLGASPLEMGPFINNTAGTVEYSLARQGPTTPPTPAGTFATITITVNGAAPPGTYNLDITSMGLANETVQPIPDIVINDGTVNVTITDTPPVYSNIQVTPASPATCGQTYIFNITVQDNVAVDTVLLQFGGINYTCFTYPNSVFSYNFTHLAAGTYSYKWYMNDTSNNWNSTSIFSYVITCPWDINGDCTINYLDLAILGAHWGQTTTSPYPAYDINKDGTVNYLDLAILGAHWGQTC